jgi:hypothetical protein
MPVLNADTCAWLHDDVPLSGETNLSLAFTGAQQSDAGEYELVVGNAAGVVTSAPIAVAVIPEPAALLAGLLLGAAVVHARRALS